MTSTGKPDRKYVSPLDFEEYARQTASKNAFNYYVSGANGQHTLKENFDAFNRIKLKARVLRNVKNIDLTTTVFGRKISLPIGISPSAMHKLVDPEGEVATARAARNTNTIYTMSTLSTTSIQDVAKESKEGFRFFQLYVTRNREISRNLVKQAEEEGFSALVLTVDAPVLGKREADERENFHLPPPHRLEVLSSLSTDFFGKEKQELKQGGGFLLQMFKDQVDPSITWEEAKWLKTITKLPVIVKGIHCAEDAQLALDHGMDGIWVSNHGGRQLDTVPATIDILPEVMEVVRKSKKKVEVFVDSGFRRGTDVVKALCMGASCVFLGRPALWALACEGSRGVEKMIKMMEDDLKMALMLMGCAKIVDLDDSYLVTKHNPYAKL